ncbi:hypothetical protein LMG26690_04819 [Achromobacter animicus]|uniref:Uncharacterized protein n=1 Tax=Achromobacter animicus TaxID=1389935 RepID=A0A6S7ARB3_9BURK|nr:hypothetical protein LMG26690_04819 [Achromobacter animicus]
MPGQHRHFLHGAAHAARDGLHAVARFACMGALEPHARTRRFRVFGQTAAVGEDQHRVARRCAVIFYRGPTQAGFREQARQKGVIGFTVLRGVGPRRQAGQVVLHIGSHLVGIAFIAVQHMAHDVQHRLVLVDAAVAPLRGKPQPGRERQAIPGHAGIAAQHLGGSHHAAAAGLGAVGARGPQRGGPRHHVVQIERGIFGQRHHAHLAQRAQAFARDPAFDLQGRHRALAIKPEKTGLGAETAVASVDSHGRKTSWERGRRRHRRAGKNSRFDIGLRGRAFRCGAPLTRAYAQAALFTCDEAQTAAFLQPLRQRRTRHLADEHAVGLVDTRAGR